MKQLALVSLVSVALFGALAIPAFSQTGDGTLDVNMSLNVTLSVTASSDQVDYMNLTLGAVNILSQPITVTNTSNIPARLMIAGTDATPVSSEGNPAVWTLECDPAVVGTNKYVHKFWRTSPDVTAREPLCDGASKELAASVPIGTDIGVRLELNTPTGTTGYGPRTSRVFITATAP